MENFKYNLDVKYNMKNINLTTIIVVALIVIGGLIGISMLKSPSENTISASGAYQMSVMPDQAIVYLLIETRSKSAEEAKNQNSLISEKVFSSLESIGIKKSDIEAENYNIYPEYDWSDNKQTLKGYIASNSIKIKTADFDNIGKIVDLSVDAGALVSYINFDLSIKKNNEYKSIVLSEASKDARVRAESIASGLGKKLGSLVSVSSSDYNYMPYPLYAMADSGVALEKAVTDIQPKNLEINAAVTVSYEIK